MPTYKKTPLPKRAGSELSLVRIELTTAAFGSFQRVNLGFGGGSYRRDMGSQVAIAALPLDGRLRASAAIPAGLDFRRAAATFARLDDFVAEAPIVTAPFGGHESAFIAFADSLADHGINSPFRIIAQKNGQTNAQIWPSANL
jgi:hypothetical protein